jgi:hypothetical protein
MTSPQQHALARRSFRSGSEYDLVAYDRLPPQEAVLLAELRADANFYGILRPIAGSARNIRAVDRDTALLWLGAQTPGALPFFVWEGPPAATHRRVVQLVLDGVLEVEHEGAFVSGAKAFPVIGEEAASCEGAERAGELALAALRYGQALRLGDPDLLAARLYRYGTMPLTPTWARRLPDPALTLGFLGASEGTALAHRLRTCFTEVHGGRSDSWLAWSNQARRPLGGDEPTYKLYASPVPDDLPAAFFHVAEVLSCRDHLQFKVGASATGVLRPDKLVVYFGDLDTLRRASDDLARRLTGLRSHGVPFAAEIASGGMLSWGVDPPRTARALAWQDAESWRLVVVRRLAAALIAAQTDSGPMEPARYALERLRLDGVDVDRWAPPSGRWWLE